MLRYYFYMYFICIFCIFFEVKYCSSKENAIMKRNSSTAFVPTRQCQSTLCTCNDTKTLGAVNCTEHTERGVNYFETDFGTGNYLPAGFLRGQSIAGMSFNETDVNVDENIFEGMIHLSKFNVLRSSIQKVPDFRFIRESIKNISIDSSHLTSLEGENLQNLTKLQFLGFKHNSIRFIDPDVFMGTENLLFLDLSFNELMTIPPNLLDPMKKLKYFYASHNNLLHVNEVFSVTQPSHISLSFNNITDLYSVLQLNKEKVRTYMHGITRRQHKDLNLIRCENQLNLNLVKILYEIEFLNLGFNSIEDTSQSFSPCYYNQFGGYNFRLKALHLGGNKIRDLNALLRHSITIRVGLGGNKIQSLTDKDFISVDGLDCIDFRSNEIRFIDTDTFKPISIHIFCLDLSSNFITSINGSIRHLAHLSFLNLSSNLIQTFSEDEFTGLNDLSRLFLEKNQIKSLGNLQQLRKLKTLNIAQNDLQVIRPEKLPVALMNLQMAGNSFMCTCRLLPFIEQFIGNMFRKTDILLCIRSNFRNLTGNVLLEQFSKETQSCPDKCSCSCTEYGDISFMFVNCSSQNLTVVPHFLGNNSSEMKENETITSDYKNPFTVHQNINPFLQMEDRVMGINLENNNLESIERFQLPPNLTQLFLSNNKLRSLPDSILDNQLNLKEISLSRNPWICDCSTLNFKKWLILNQDSIQDINDTRCGASDKAESNLIGRTIFTLTDLELCPTNLSLVLALSISILSILIFSMVAKLLYNKYSFNIKVFLYSYGFTFVKEKDLDYDKTFDAFISFSNTDGEFVTKEIIEEIERRIPNICLCIHYRHFVPGEFIYENITRAVGNSKKTVLVLSKNFLDSEWCLLEFRTAHIQALEDRIHRIIVIIIGDLPDDINPAVKAYLGSTTYLTWGEKHFWNKLLYVLPNGTSVRNPNPINVDDEEFLNCATSPV